MIRDTWQRWQMDIHDTERRFYCSRASIYAILRHGNWVYYSGIRRRSLPWFSLLPPSPMEVLEQILGLSQSINFKHRRWDYYAAASPLRLRMNLTEFRCFLNFLRVIIFYRIPKVTSAAAASHARISSLFTILIFQKDILKAQSPQRHMASRPAPSGHGDACATRRCIRFSRWSSDGARSIFWAKANAIFPQLSLLVERAKCRLLPEVHRRHSFVGRWGKLPYYRGELWNIWYQLADMPRRWEGLISLYLKTP